MTRRVIPDRRQDREARGGRPRSRRSSTPPTPSWWRAAIWAWRPRRERPRGAAADHRGGASGRQAGGRRDADARVDDARLRGRRAPRRATWPTRSSAAPTRACCPARPRSASYPVEAVETMARIAATAEEVAHPRRLGPWRSRDHRRAGRGERRRLRPGLRPVSRGHRAGHPVRRDRAGGCAAPARRADRGRHARRAALPAGFSSSGACVRSSVAFAQDTDTLLDSALDAVRRGGTRGGRASRSRSPRAGRRACAGGRTSSWSATCERGPDAP